MLAGTTDDISMIFNSKGAAECERENNLKGRWTECIEEISLVRMEYCCVRTTICKSGDDSMLCKKWGKS